MTSEISNAQAKALITTRSSPHRFSLSSRHSRFDSTTTAILAARLLRIRLPGLNVEATWRREDGFIDRKTWSEPAVEVDLTSELEERLGCVVPGVLAEWVDDNG